MMTIILFAMVICLFVLICVLLYWVYYYKSKLYAQNDMFLYYKNKISMIEYQYRNFKEGKNPYTVLRDLGEIIQSYYIRPNTKNGDNNG